MKTLFASILGLLLVAGIGTGLWEYQQIADLQATVAALSMNQATIAKTQTQILSNEKTLNQNQQGLANKTGELEQAVVLILTAISGPADHEPAPSNQKYVRPDNRSRGE